MNIPPGRTDCSTTPERGGKSPFLFLVISTSSNSNRLGILSKELLVGIWLMYLPLLDGLDGATLEDSDVVGHDSKLTASSEKKYYIEGIF